MQKFFPLNMHARNADVSLLHIIIISMKFYMLQPLYNTPGYNTALGISRLYLSSIYFYH